MTALTFPRSILLCLTLAILVGGPLRAWSQEAFLDEPDPSPAARVWAGVRVVDTQGWEYRDVTIRWVGDGAALEVQRSDGAVRSFSPDRITHVYAADGNEITAAVAAARYGGRQPAVTGTTDAPATDDAPEFAVPAPAAGPTETGPAGPPLFGVAIEAALGYATHTGAWFTGLEDGLNFQVGLRAMVGPRSWLHFAFRRQDLGTVIIGYDEYLGESVAVDVALNEYQILMGRHAPLVTGKSLSSVGYAEFGVSLMDHRFNYVGYSAGDSETKMGLVLQGGLLALLDEGLALDLSASATWKPGSSKSEGAGLLLGAHVGLSVSF